MFLLIFNEQRVPKITFVLVLTYYVKPHLFVILTAIGWFIVNIQSDLYWTRLNVNKALSSSNGNVCITLSITKNGKRKLSKFGTYNTFLSLIPCYYFPLYFSKKRVYTSEGYRKLAFLTIDDKRDLRAFALSSAYWCSCSFSTNNVFPKLLSF
jgi:hypothetical protein